MADELNRATILGNLGADPELRHTAKGDAILSLRIATTDSYLDGGRERREKTEWHSVTVWGKRRSVAQAPPQGLALLRRGPAADIELRGQGRGQALQDGHQRAPDHPRRRQAQRRSVAGGGRPAAGEERGPVTRR